MKKIIFLMLFALLFMVSCDSGVKTDVDNTVSDEDSIATDDDSVAVDEDSVVTDEDSVAVDKPVIDETSDADDTPVACKDGCLISSICYPDGVANPANVCQKCDVATAQDAWSDNDGAKCDDDAFCTENDVCSAGKCAGTAKTVDDGIACNGVESCNEATDAIDTTGNQCTGVQICDLGADLCVDKCPGCLIDAVCYGEGQANPTNVCQKCNIATAKDAWSDSDGIACDDGLFCNGADTCGGGTCSVNVGNPCTGSDTCFETEPHCCEPGIGIGELSCSASGNVIQKDSCGDDVLVEACVSPGSHGRCLDSVCGCEVGYSGDDCTSCIVFVDGLDGDDTNDGSAWSEALQTVDAGLVAAQGELCEVWVAAGLYTPGDGVARSASFKMIADVDMYGGFAGDEEMRSQRDVEHNKTILSGEINDPAELSDNVYHVVVGATAIIDGFTIRDGYASGSGDDEHGGGMVNLSVAPTIVNCSFSYNYADGVGGAILNENSSSVIEACLFSGNQSGKAGGAIFDTDFSSTITECLFIGNQTVYFGGAIYFDSGELAITKSTFNNNEASNGGAIFIEDSSLTMKNSSLHHNNAVQGGAVMTSSAISELIVGCSFTDNTVTLYGGAFSNDGATDGQYINCQFVNNRADKQGGAMFSQDSSLKMVNTLFADNSSGDLAGALLNSKTTTEIINSTFVNNSADNDAGAIQNEASSNTTLVNSIVWGNSLPQIVVAAPGSSCDIDHSIVEGGYTGTGNLDVDPLFVDDSAGDYHLQSTSPAIDVGDNAALPKDVADLDEDSDVSEQIPFDLDGKSRIVNSIVDMGVYEVQ